MATLQIVGGKIWQGANAGFVQRDLLIVDGIVAEHIPAQAQVETLNVRGGYVLPGFIDAHFHAYATSMQGMENELGPLSYAALNGAERLRKALKRGFTTVRDVAGGDIGLARAISEGLFPSPRYLYTGPALSQTGGHGDPRAAAIDVCFSHGHMCEIADGVEQLRLAVRNRLRGGAHAIKIMTSGGVFSLADPLTIPQYSPTEIRVVCEEAHRRGSYVAAHAYSAAAVLHSISNGVRSIEHGNLIDSATAQEMAKLGAFLVPTLAAYDAMDRRGAELGLNPISLAKNNEVLSRGQEAVQLALAHGVAVGFGSDLMGDLEDDQLRGVQLQCLAAGPAATIHSLSTVNAKLLGDARAGALTPGSYGDAIVLTADPLSTPEALWSQDARSHVLQAGKVVI